MNSASEISLTADPSLPSLDSRGVSRFIQEQAAARPSHPAIESDGITFTYKELLVRSTIFAVELKSRGVTAGDRVGLLFSNQPDYVAAFFAITGIGGTVVPINPLLKSEEIAHVLTDSKAKALIVQDAGFAEVAKALPSLSDLTHVIIVGETNTTVAGASVSIEQLKLDCHSQNDASSTTLKNFAWTNTVNPSKDLAVLVYTSGTTGKPKGAMLTHENLLSTVRMAHRCVDVNSDDRFLVMIPLCHIYGLAVVMMGVLAKGGTLVLLERFDPATALTYIQDRKITGLPAVPAMYQFMLMELEKTDYDLASLRVCLSGAAAMPMELYNRLQKRIPVPILEGYGLTETSSVVSINPIKGKVKVGSVGLPIHPIEVQIIDANGTQLPSGSDNVGEVAVKGSNVMVGYFNKPVETAECLENGWFRTGDLGYKDDDGYLYIVGRSKELIIRGGQNIYPREVEDVIIRMPQVAEVAVIGVPDQYMGERVKAIVVLRAGKELNEEDVKAFCAQHLAEYKVPRLVEFIGALPRNSTGKVLKRLLQK